MISILAFIIVMFGSLNWLCIGFFQYDLVAGLFGYQGSIFSRIVYIIVGICAVYLIFVMIKNKGRLTVKKLKKEEQPMIDQMTKKSPEQIAQDQQIADNIKYESEHHHDSQFVTQPPQNDFNVAPNQNINNQNQVEQNYTNQNQPNKQVATHQNYEQTNNQSQANYNQNQQYNNQNVSNANQNPPQNNSQVDTQNLNNQQFVQNNNNNNQN